MSGRNVVRIPVLCDCARKFNAFLVSAFLSFCLFLSAPLFAQVNTGRILGTVTDQSGGVIAGAMVTVTNTGTGVARTLTADDAGAFVAPNLTPGTYSVRATAMGFQAFERQNIMVGVGQDARADAQLMPGQVTQTIQVTESSVQIDTTSAVVSGTVSAQTITNLPLNGRNFQNLLTLQSGVVSSPGGGSLTTSTNGLQPQDNNYVFEGLDGNDPYSGQSITNTSLPFGDAATILPADAIQELNVETNPPAEFGRRPGAVINIGIKSGTNAIHGTAFAFGRDGSWDARDFINPAPTTPPQPLELEQYGGSVGGPILKNKLFYFGSFERQTYDVGTALNENIPTSLAGQGTTISIPDAEADLAAHSIPLNTLSVNLLPQYGTNNTNSSSIGRGFPYVFAINNGIGKIDYHLSDHHAFSGSYYRGEGTGLGEDSTRTQPYFRSDGTMTSSFLTTSWTWTVNSNWVNDLRFGWNLFSRIDNVADSQVPVTNYGINTGVTAANLQGFPTISVSGFTDLGGDSRAPKLSGPGNDYDIVDHVSFLHGKHDFQFGGEFLTFRAFFNEVSIGRGQFKFTGGKSQPIGSLAVPTALEAYLAGVPNQGSILQGISARNLKQSSYSGFFDDTWRIKPHVTVDLGLRYEYFTPLADRNNLIGSWDPSVGFEQVGVNIKNPYNPDAKDFSPRVGVAWDISGKGTTVLRAGGGIYYTNIIADQLINSKGGVGRAPGITAIPTSYTLFAADGSSKPGINTTANGIGSASATIPGSQLNWTVAGPVFPSTISSNFSCGDGISPGGGAPNNPAPCNIVFTPPSMPSPRVFGWNVGVEHAFSPNISLKANYVGNHGTRLPGLRNVNQLNPQSPGELAFTCGKPVGSANHCENPQDLPYFSSFPYLFGITELTDADISYYNGLQLTLAARLHNLSINGGYTYSHALSDLPGSDFHSTIPQDSLHPMNDYGAAQFDVRHHFGLTFTYNIPGIKSPLQLLQGWAINSSIVVQSGLPWSVVDTRDLSSTGQFQDRWDFFGNPRDFKAVGTPIPFFASGSAMPAACTNAAAASNGTATLNYGCYVRGSSVMIGPAPGFFGTMSRNEFYYAGFHNWDFSVFKNWTFKERLTAQFRAEFFNILNFTNYANPSLAGKSDPSLGFTGQFGCGCETPDVANTNPVLGSGAAREIQLGLKLLF